MTTPADNDPKISPSKSPEQIGKPISPGGAPEGFESLMQGTKGQANVQGPSPMQMAASPNAPPTLDSLNAQAKNAKDSLGTIEKQLKDKNLNLKRSQNHLVRQKLTDANSYIRSAGAKMGANLPDEQNYAKFQGGNRFIAMVNDGQNQLFQVQEQLKEMGKKGASVSPADMMAIQVKMGLAQQEIEYTSTLLGKVIQSTTQIMNTQL